MAETRDQVSFLLNGVRHDVPRSVPPTRTLLDYLREDLRLTGTKEGCNEGDCGACTVVVTGPDGVARAVNACIQFVPMVDGLSVTTVEGLRGPNGELHPVQQAMVDCHGSQCGFCTPGFVMSLYAAYQSPEDAVSEIDDLLAGNLCRCTGYGPIVAAAKRALADPLPTTTTVELPSPLWGGTGGGVLGSLAIEHPNGKFFAPTTVDELASLFETHPQATILGGATDVGLWVTKQHRDVPVLISTQRVGELRRLERRRDCLVLHSGCTYSECEVDLSWYWPGLQYLFRRLGSVQVRNSGTIGGNIANGSPIGDMAPALIALGATVNLRKGAEHRSVPLEDFFIDYGKQDRRPGEFIVSLSIKGDFTGDFNDHVNWRLACYKISKRFDQDISAVCGCFYLTVENGTVSAARIAFGGMASTPKRAKAVENELIGKPWTLQTVEAAQLAFDIDFQPISDMRASAGYRRQVAKNLLVRHYHETTADVMSRLVGRGARIMKVVGSDAAGPDAVGSA